MHVAMMYSGLSLCPSALVQWHFEKQPVFLSRYAERAMTTVFPLLLTGLLCVTESPHMLRERKKSEIDFRKSVQVAPTLLGSLRLRVTRVPAKVQIANETLAQITILINT